MLFTLYHFWHFSNYVSPNAFTARKDRGFPSPLLLPVEAGMSTLPQKLGCEEHKILQEIKMHRAKVNAESVCALLYSCCLRF